MANPAAGRSDRLMDHTSMKYRICQMLRYLNLSRASNRRQQRWQLLRDSVRSKHF